MSLSLASTVTLNDGNQIPMLGLGVFMSKDGEEVYNAVRAAIDAGYRHIDTAAAYGNEASVGKAVRECGVPREEIFVTTKLWNTHIRAGTNREAIEESLKLLGLEYVDLYLIHWPAEGYEKAWQDLIAFRKEGLTKSIGVCNFQCAHLHRLFGLSDVRPAINQIESHPRLPQMELIRWGKENGYAVEAWSPLGGNRTGQSLREHPTIMKIAQKHGKTAVQVLIRWQLQRGIIVLPKSAHAERVISNADVYDFELDLEDLKEIAMLDDGFRYGSSPDTFTF